MTVYTLIPGLAPKTQTQQDAEIAANTASIKANGFKSGVIKPDGTTLEITRPDDTTYDIDLSSLKAGGSLHIVAAGNVAIAAPTSAQVAALPDTPSDVATAIVVNSSGDTGYYRSNDAGATWAAIVSTPAYALKAELHDGAAQDAAIALRELLANKETSVPADGVADDTKYPTSKAVRDEFEALPDYVLTGSAATRDALGAVPAKTPFFNETLGELQYFSTETDAFMRTDSPANFGTWTTGGFLSATNFKLSLSPSDATNNSTLVLPDGVQTEVWIVAENPAGSLVLGGSFIVRNDGGVVTKISDVAGRRWGPATLDWTTVAFEDITTPEGGALVLSQGEINGILSNVAGGGVWKTVGALGSPAFSEIVEPFATDGASFPAEPADAAPDKAYLTVLTADDIGTGTAENPQFRSGQYLTLGSGWLYYGSSTAIRPELTDAELASITDTKVGAVSGQSLFNRDFTRQGQSTDFAANDGQQIIPKVWSAERLVTQFGIPTEDRVIYTGGNYAIDPLTTLSNTNLNQYLRYIAVDNPVTITPVLTVAMITVWKDYSGNNIPIPTTDDEAFTIPADVTMTVHREGNELKFVFYANAGGDTTGVVDVGGVYSLVGDFAAADMLRDVIPNDNNYRDYVENFTLQEGDRIWMNTSNGAISGVVLANQGATLKSWNQGPRLGIKQNGTTVQISSVDGVGATIYRMHVQREITIKSVIPAGDYVVEATPNKFKIGTRLQQEGVTVAVDGTVTVTFPEPFKAGIAPVIMATAHSAGDNANVTLQTVSSTGFTAWLVQNEGNVGLSYNCHWMATGQPA